MKKLFIYSRYLVVKYSWYYSLTSTQNSDFSPNLLKQKQNVCPTVGQITLPLFYKSQYDVSEPIVLILRFQLHNSYSYNYVQEIHKFYNNSSNLYQELITIHASTPELLSNPFLTERSTCMYCIGVIMAVSSARMSIQLYRKFFIFSIQTLVERARLKKTSK